MVSTVQFARLHNSGTPPELVEGTLVGSRRWPSAAAHPDCWEPPHKGVVLSQTDVRAWSRTIAFSAGEPSLREVTLHVAQLHARNLLVDDVPVLWDFPDGPQVYWSRPQNLKPAEDDYRDWVRARALAYERVALPHLAAA